MSDNHIANKEEYAFDLYYHTSNDVKIFINALHEFFTLPDNKREFLLETADKLEIVDKEKRKSHKNLGNLESIKQQVEEIKIQIENLSNALSNLQLNSEAESSEDNTLTSFKF